MPNNLYLAAVEPRSGKSLVVLGIVDLLSRRVSRLAFFRPVIRAGDRPDSHIALVRGRYGLKLPYEACYGVTHDVAREMTAAGQYDRLLKRILARYKEAERQADFVICEGTDYTGVAAAFEFDFNGDVASLLGCPVVLIGNGAGKTEHELAALLQSAREMLAEQGCTIAATFVNRLPPDRLPATLQLLQSERHDGEPLYLLPDVDELVKPTVAEVAAALQAKVLHGEAVGLAREVHSYKVAAMELPNLLERLRPNCLIVTPGDRADVILGCLGTFFSENVPSFAGLMLTGGLMPPESVLNVVRGFKLAQVPILLVETDTYETATDLIAVVAEIAPDQDRKISTALGVFEQHVDLGELESRIAATRSTTVTPLMFEYELIERAKADRQHIVLPEGTDPRILQAAEILHRRGVAELTLLGDERAIWARIAEMGLQFPELRIVDPAASPWHAEFAATYLELRKHKGITREVAEDVVRDVSYFGTLMVHLGYADGMVSGAAHTTAHTVRPAFEIIRTCPGCSIVSSVFLMCLRDRVLVYGDCAIIPNPTAEQLADIAISSAATARMFGIDPVVAMLSYSSGESGKGEDVDRVRQATHIARQRRPDLSIEGPIQYDAAIDPGVAQKKMPNSAVAGRATVFIFPDLNTGNNTYKAVQRSAGAVAVGPVLQGLNKPVNDLSRGCTVADVVNTVAITAIQAQRQDAGVPQA